MQFNLKFTRFVMLKDESKETSQAFCFELFSLIHIAKLFAMQSKQKNYFHSVLFLFSFLLSSPSIVVLHHDMLLIHVRFATISHVRSFVRSYMRFEHQTDSQTPVIVCM